MKNKTKFVAVALAAVVLIGAGTLLFFDGGMDGKGLFFNRQTPVCSLGAVVYSSEKGKGTYGSFDEFVNAVKNGTLQDCNYVVQGAGLVVQKDQDSFIASCKKSFMAGFTDQTPTVSCMKKVGADFLRVDLYKDNALVLEALDTQDNDGFSLATYKTYKPYEFRVN